MNVPNSLKGWLAHVEGYKQKHPGITHKDALREAAPSYHVVNAPKPKPKRGRPRSVPVQIVPTVMQRKWFYSFFQPTGLLASGPELAPGNVIVCQKFKCAPHPQARPGDSPSFVPERRRQTKHGIKTDERKFTVFNNEEELWNYVCLLKADDSDAYECVMHDAMQKPRFDIDIKCDATNAKQMMKIYNTIVAQLTDVIAGLCTDPDVEEFPSHGLTKCSGHVVATSVVHVNNVDARNFYNRVLDQIDEELRQYIDHAVYSSFQQFRLLCCSKLGANRPKHVKDGINNLAAFRRSLLGYTKDCKQLPLSPGPVLEAKKATANVGTDGVSEAIVMLEALTDAFERRKEGNADGETIWLNRLKAAECIVCNREHEHENAKLRIKGTSVYFNCPRKPKDSKYLGELKRDLKEASGHANLPQMPSLEEIKQAIAHVVPQHSLEVKEDTKALQEDPKRDLKEASGPSNQSQGPSLEEAQKAMHKAWAEQQPVSKEEVLAYLGIK